MTPLFPPFGNAAMGAPPGATLGSGGKTEGALGLMEPSGCERAFTSSEEGKTMAEAEIIPFQDSTWGADYCSKEGAQSLAEKIEAYWRARGMHVMCALRDAGFHPAVRSSRFDVRSDMVNGLPRSLPPAAEQTEAA